MNELETLKQQNEKLKKSLSDLVGSIDKKELGVMRDCLYVAEIPNKEKVAMINAIDLLIEIL